MRTRDARERERERVRWAERYGGGGATDRSPGDGGQQIAAALFKRKLSIAGIPRYYTK